LATSGRRRGSIRTMNDNHVISVEFEWKLT